MARQPPVGRPGPTQCRGFTITLRHPTLSRTPLDEWQASRRDLFLTTQPPTKEFHTASGIRTHDPCKRAAADPRLKPRGHWDWLSAYLPDVIRQTFSLPEYWNIFTKFCAENVSFFWKWKMVQFCIPHTSLEFLAICNYYLCVLFSI